MIMRKSSFYHIATILVALILSSASFAEDGKLIHTKGAFIQQLQERDSVLIADQLLYGFDLTGVEEGTQFAFPTIKDTLMSGVDVVSGWKMDTLKVVKGRKGTPNSLDLRGGITITTFDEGVYYLPPLAVQRLSKDGVLDTLVFDAQTLEVKTMPVDTATFKVHDIKAQIRYPVTFKEVIPWVGLGLGIAGLIALALWLLVKYAGKRKEIAEKKEPAHIVALRKLDNYRGNKMWAPEKQKIFYSGITDALREYIGERYDFGAMEMTTAEIMQQMQKTDVDAGLKDGLKDLFERADFVKFAKFIASDEENAAALPMAVRFVTSTYQSQLEENQTKEGGE